MTTEPNEYPLDNNGMARPRIRPYEAETSGFLVLANDEAYETFLFEGYWLRIRTRGVQTKGLYEVIEDHFPPGFYMPVHLHKEHDETFYVVDGEMDFVIGDDTVRMSKGMSVFVPRGVPHRATSENGAQVVTTVSPPFLEDVLRAREEAGDKIVNDPEKLNELLEAHDIFFVRE